MNARWKLQSLYKNLQNDSFSILHKDTSSRKKAMNIYGNIINAILQDEFHIALCLKMANWKFLGRHLLRPLCNKKVPWFYILIDSLPRFSHIVFPKFLYFPSFFFAPNPSSLLILWLILPLARVRGLREKWLGKKVKDYLYTCHKST